MKTQTTYKIVLLDDSEFYNRMLFYQMKEYAARLADALSCFIEIQTYTSSSDFLVNLKPETDLAFIDYYLGNGITGDDILENINKKCSDCKVILFSAAQNEEIPLRAISHGADGFVPKNSSTMQLMNLIMEKNLVEKIKAAG